MSETAEAINWLVVRPADWQQMLPEQAVIGAGTYRVWQRNWDGPVEFHAARWNGCGWNSPCAFVTRKIAQDACARHHETGTW